jgi:hypothetical protein
MLSRLLMGVRQELVPSVFRGFNKSPTRAQHTGSPFLACG